MNCFGRYRTLLRRSFFLPFPQHQQHRVALPPVSLQIFCKHLSDVLSRCISLKRWLEGTLFDRLYSVMVIELARTPHQRCLPIRLSLTLGQGEDGSVLMYLANHMYLPWGVQWRRQANQRCLKLLLDVVLCKSSARFFSFLLWTFVSISSIVENTVCSGWQGYGASSNSAFGDGDSGALRTAFHWEPVKNWGWW